jgi:hypothetical protein
MRKNTLAVLSLASLFGCGGGGGGGGNALVPPESNEVTFTSFAAIQPNQTVNFSGISQAASGTGTIFDVNSLAIGGVDTSNTTAKAKFDGTEVLSAFSITTPQGGVSLDRNAGATFTCGDNICDAFDPASEVVVIDPTAVGWNYQTFGVWNKNISATEFQVGAFSIGSPTPASAVPLTGLATFVGLATGFYVANDQTPYVTVAGMNADVNFGARSIGFSTSDTVRADLATATPTLDPGLNLSGTFTYSAGTNQFSGPLTTQNTSLSGSGTGQFYGPNAQELGGVYSLTGSGGNMLGAFGGKR